MIQANSHPLNPHTAHLYWQPEKLPQAENGPESWRRDDDDDEMFKPLMGRTRAVKLKMVHIPKESTNISLSNYG